MSETIAKAYIQLLPDATGLKGNIEKELFDVTESTEAAGRDAGRKFSDSMNSAARSLAPVSAAATGIGAAIITATSSFDKSMSNVQAIAGLTADDLQKVRDRAKEMGETTRFSATDAADALSYMAMAGWKADDMYEGLPGVMNLAAASGEDLATTSDIVTDALTAFKMSAEQSAEFADVLAAAASNSNTNVSMMGDTFKYVAPVAGTLGYSAQDTAIAIGLMANSGIKASQAGTALRNIMTNMSKPTDNMQMAMDRLGVSLDDGHGHMYSLREVMGQLRESFKDVQFDTEKYDEGVAYLNKQLEAGEITEKEYNKQVENLAETTLKAADAQKAELAAMLAGKYGMSGLLAIVNATDEDMAHLTESIDGASDTIVMTADGSMKTLAQALADGDEVMQEYNGTAEAMSNIMQNNLSGDMDQLKSKLEALAIDLGEIIMPIARDLVDGLADIVSWVNGLDDGQKKLLLGIVGVTAVAAPVLGIIGTIAGGISNIIALGTTLGPVINTVGNGFVTLAGHAGALGVSLGAVATAALAVADGLLIAYDTKTLIDAAETYNEAQEAHNQETEQAMNTYAQIFQDKGKDVADEWAKMAYEIDTTGMSMDEAQRALAAKVESYWDDVPENMWEGFAQGWNHYFGADGKGLGALLGDAFSGAVEGVGNLLGIHSPSTVFEDFGINVGIGFQQGWSQQWSQVDAMVSAGASGILSAFDGLDSDLNTIGNNAMIGLGNGLIGAMNGVLDTAQSIASSIINTTKSAFQIHSPSRVFYGIGEDVSNGLALGIRGAADDAISETNRMSDKIVSIGDLSALSARQTSAGAVAETSTDAVLALLTEYLPQLANMTIMMDKGVVAGQLTPDIDVNMGMREYYSSREVYA